MNKDLGSKITVCLLTYNHAHLLESGINTILEQTLDGYEILISDDCSTDGTWDLLNRIAQREKGVKLIRTPVNLGMAANANFAVKHITRPYIALLHHDDLYKNNLLEKWGHVLEKDSQIGFVFNSYAVYESDQIYQAKSLSEKMPGQWLLKNYLLPRWGCVVRGTAMIRRDVWMNIGGMREQFGLLADVDMWMRISRQYSVGYVNEPVVIVRQCRPKDYPDDYKAYWSWPRQKLLYEIHAINRLEFYNKMTLKTALQWYFFKWRLSAETIKWLVYAIVRKKREMVLSSLDSETAYDIYILKIFRLFLLFVYSKLDTQNSTPLVE